MHPETWHILPGESNWEEGDPCAIYLTHDGKWYNILFVLPILRDIVRSYSAEVIGDEEDTLIDWVFTGLREYIITENEACSAFTYYVVHELLHWGLAE